MQMALFITILLSFPPLTKGRWLEEPEGWIPKNIPPRPYRPPLLLKEGKYFSGRAPRNAKNFFRGSSNGRTAGFGPVNRGSNPCPRA